MIAVDTSALMVIVLGEVEAAKCMKVLRNETEVLISAGTVAEALIVTSRCNVSGEMATLIKGLAFNVATITTASARRIGEAYKRWGKGLHPAGLNFRRLLFL